MKKIHILHTRFQDVYTINRKVKEKIFPFGYDKAIASIVFKDKLKISCKKFIFNDINEMIIVISDSLFGESYQKEKLSKTQKKVLNRLNEAINSEDKIFFYYHKRTQFKDTITKLMEDNFENQIELTGGFSHLENKDSPFYSLVKIVESKSKEHFEKKLEEMQNVYLKSDEEMEKDKIKEILKGIEIKITHNNLEEISDKEKKIAKQYINGKYKFEDLLAKEPKILAKLLLRINQNLK